MLPGPGLRFTWPSYFGRDLSRLGNWNRYLGFFEYPAAHGPFVGVYDPTLDAGAVRIYPAEIAQGSKVFGLGWRNRIGSEDFTDDGSGYVELHGGLSPTFDDPYTLAGGEVVSWQESWYPVKGINNLVYATQSAALGLTRTRTGLQVALYPTAAFSGTLSVLSSEDRQTLAEFPLHLAAAEPFVGEINQVAADASVIVRVQASDGEVVLEYIAGGSHQRRW